MNKKSVFVSYAHNDTWDFTRRLVFSLKMYMDVFWDGQLETGPFDPQLYLQIEASDCFLLIMSPLSLREGGWCRKELAHAKDHKLKHIVLARRFDKCGQPELERELATTFTYGDFTEDTDFDAGFRRVTAMMLGEPVSSWEYLAQEKEDKVVMQNLQDGILPGIIAKNVAEWIIVDAMWSYIEGYITEKEHFPFEIIRGKPRTPMGVYRHCTPIIEQFINMRDQAAVQLLLDVSRIAKTFVDQLQHLQDNEHELACKIAWEINTKVYNLIGNKGVATGNIRETMAVAAYSQFNTSEKIRELINQYARRSRYLF